MVPDSCVEKSNSPTPTRTRRLCWSSHDVSCEVWKDLNSQTLRGKKERKRKKKERITASQILLSDKERKISLLFWLSLSLRLVGSTGIGWSWSRQFRPLTAALASATLLLLLLFLGGRRTRGRSSFDWKWTRLLKSVSSSHRSPLQDVVKVRMIANFPTSSWTLSQLGFEQTRLLLTLASSLSLRDPLRLCA